MNQLAQIFSALLIPVMFILAFTTMGCVHSKVINANSLSDANEVFQKGRHKIVLENGERITAERIQVGVDTVYWADSNSGMANQAATARIAYIQDTRHGQGALEGLTIGILAGALTGALLGAATYEECVPEGFLGCLFAPESASQQAGLGALGGMALGFVGGIMVGGVSGSKQRYVMQFPDSSGDGMKEAPGEPLPLREALMGSVVVGDRVIVKRFDQFWPLNYQGKLLGISQRHITMKVDGRRIRIERRTISFIRKID